MENTNLFLEVPENSERIARNEKSQPRRVNLNRTGLARNSRIGPAARLGIPIRGSKLAHFLGQGWPDLSPTRTHPGRVGDGVTDALRLAADGAVIKC